MLKNKYILSIVLFIYLEFDKIPYFMKLGYSKTVCSIVYQDKNLVSIFYCLFGCLRLLLSITNKVPERLQMNALYYP